MLLSCDCSCSDYDAPAVYQSRMVLARKPHGCCECNRTIEPGERYEVVRGLWDGQWSGYTTCLGCVRIRQHFCSSGWLHGDLAEQVSDCLGFNYVLDDDDDEDEDDDCGKPCRYEQQCGLCRPYWDRMVAEGLWDKGWTDTAIREATK